MKEKIFEATINSCRTVLKPIIKIFLRLGVSHKAFSDISKSVYVDIAVEEYPDRTNISDIALRTGISRKEVGKVLDKIEEQSLITSEKLALDNIIVEWFKSGVFTDEIGEPLHLPLRSKNGPNLEDLVRTAKLDIPLSTILRLIHQSQRILVDESGHYFPQSRSNLMGELDEYELRHIAGMIYGFLNTIEQNLHTTTENRVFQRCSYVPQLSQEDFGKFKIYCEAKLPDLMIEFDDWLNLNQETELGTDANQGLSGLGVYLYDYKSLPYP